MAPKKGGAKGGKKGKGGKKSGSSKGPTIIGKWSRILEATDSYEIILHLFM